MTNLPVLSFFQYNLISGKLYLIPLMEAGKKMKNVKILNHIFFFTVFRTVVNSNQRLHRINLIIHDQLSIIKILIPKWLN